MCRPKLLDPAETQLAGASGARVNRRKVAPGFECRSSNAPGVRGVAQNARPPGIACSA